MGHPDAPALDELLRHAAFVRAVARAAVRGDDAVDDVVQETWLAALHSGPRDRSSLRAWLAGVTRRQAANRQRKEMSVSRGERRAARPEGEPSTLELAERADTGRVLIEAVLSLEEPYRGAILLRYYVGAGSGGIPHFSPRKVRNST